MTHANAHNAHLQGPIEAFVKTSFPDIAILSVGIDDEAETGGERFLEINVYFEGTPDQLIERKPIGFVGSLRKKLAELHETAFPVLNFISASDIRA